MYLASVNFLICILSISGGYQVYGPTDDGNYSNNEGMEFVNRHFIIKGFLFIYLLLFLFNLFIFYRCKGSMAGKSEGSKSESFFSSKEYLLLALFIYLCLLQFILIFIEIQCLLHLCYPNYSFSQNLDISKRI